MSLKFIYQISSSNVSERAILDIKYTNLLLQNVNILNIR